MIATEPPSAEQWDDIGWQGSSRRWATEAHGFFYAQRTADGRIAIGGRAVPYRFASRTDRDGVVGQGTVSYLTEVLNSAFPQTRGVPTPTAGAGFRVPRDWTAGVSLDPATGLGRRAVMSATESPARTSPGGLLPIWCSNAPHRSQNCPGSVTTQELGARATALDRCPRDVQRLQIRRPTGGEGRSTLADRTYRRSDRA